MNKKIDLFDTEYPPIARNSDVHTSHEAEEHMNQSGKRGTHQSLLLRLIIQHPGYTSGELSMVGPLTHPQCWRRVSDLELKGLVRKGGAKKCGLTGNSASTWYAVIDRQHGKPTNE